MKMKKKQENPLGDEDEEKVEMAKKHEYWNEGERKR